LEVKEAIDVHAGRTKGPLLEVSLELGARMLMAAGLAQEPQQAKAALTKALEEGRGLEKLRQMIRAQGGDERVCDDLSRLPQAPVIREAPAPRGGVIQSMETVGLGSLAQSIGAGRRVKTDVIDPSVGFVLHYRVGDAVQAGESLATVHAQNESDAQRAIEAIQRDIVIGDQPAPRCKLLHAIVEQDRVTRL
ncbi:MAG: pyrimidine-nucleoside phosphorylase, partial [Eubacteriales bacterium]|nr:pyrimidine-nucleoside phosphorylase [Eubacteriales bacterium]